MIFSPLPLSGACLIDLERREDPRGFFARSFCEQEFAAHRLEARWVQMNISFNRLKGTLRGMHFQRPPSAEAKVVCCTRGAVFDVIVDLRAGSDTYGGWFGVELNAENRTMIYIPRGFAHGFQTLEDDSELHYRHSKTYSPGHEGGLRYDDAAIGIDWPLPPGTISDRDASHPGLHELEPLHT